MSKLREEWNHQYTVHPPYRMWVHFGSNRNAETLLQTCVRLFSFLGRFLCSQLREWQVTPIQSSAKNSGKSWWKKMPAGVSGEKQREELRDTWRSLQSSRVKRHFMDRASFGAGWLQRLGRSAGAARGSGAQLAGWCSTRLRQASAWGPPWPRGQSERGVAAAARTQGQEGKRVDWKAFLLSLKGSLQGGVQRVRMNLGIQETEPSDAAAAASPFPLVFFPSLGF